MLNAHQHPLDLVRIVDRLVSEALTTDYYEGVFANLCDALVDAGLPLLRAHLSTRILHPLMVSVELTWSRECGFEVKPREFASTPGESWLRSPLHWMVTNKLPELRVDLRDARAVDKFVVFKEIRAAGATDYLALSTPFGDPATAFERASGILTSWVSDAPDGFSPEQVAALKYLQPYVGLISKLSKHQYTAHNVMSAYLGEDAGRRVLEGQIRLGDVEHIPAVIWYSDLRNSTALAEQLPVETFLQTINTYFECTAGAVLAHRGEVLRFIGDAVLAVFPITPAVSATKAAQRAISASHEAVQRMATLNHERAVDGHGPLAFGLGLHVGDLLYGNIGVPTRIEFSVIGRAANEVTRLESLSKEVGEPVLVSRSFKEVLDLPWRELGSYKVKGIAEAMLVYAPPG